MKYRPELDGLRAIAVVAVVLYHAGFTSGQTHLFEGGFIGVDVFFVLSGYLITLILLKEMHNDSFTFADFYERRARRLLPALFAVMLVSMPFAWVYLLPEAFRGYAGSLASTVLFGSNVFFWLEDEYAADASALKPFLHTWSLAVEEQFYLVFPIALLLAWKYARKHLVGVFVAGFAASLLLAEWGSATYPSANFFLAPSRAWELLAGALLAKLEMERGRPNHRLASHTMPAVGIVMIVGSIFLLNHSTPHPAHPTLIPVIGTMLLIWFAGRGDVVSNVLSSRGFVAIGLISYSFYLWHQPIFAFARIRTAEDPALIDRLVWIALSVACATLSYWAIEKPFRNRQWISRRLIWTTATVGPAGLLMVSLYGVTTNGMPSRFNDFPQFYFEMLQAQADTKHATEAECGDYGGGTDYCRFAQGTGEVTLASVGDSHMRVLGPALLKRIEGTDAAFIPLNRAACLLVTGLDRHSEVGREHPCPSAYNQQRIAVLKQNAPVIALIGGRLPLILESSGFDNREGGVEYEPNRYWFSASQDPSATPASAEIIAQYFRATVQSLLREGIRVVLVYPVPEVGWHVPQRLAATLPRSASEDLRQWLKDNFISTSYAVFRQRTAGAYALYDGIADHPRLIRVYPEKLFCNTRMVGRCIAHDEDHVFYRDDDHLSETGAGMLVEQIFAEIQRTWGLKAAGLQPSRPPASVASGELAPAAG